MRYIITIFLIAVIPQILQAQLLTITETSAKTPIKLDPDKRVIADINGVLKIEIDKSKLAARIGRQSDPAQAQRLETMITLLKTEKEILSLLTPVIPGSAVDIAKLNAYSELMGTFLAKVADNPELRARVNILFDEAIELSVSKRLDLVEYPTQQSYVIKNLSREMNNLVDEIKTSPQVAAITIQVVAFLTTKVESDRRVHVENFDNFAAGDFFEVPRWVTSFSEDDVKKFEQMATLSEQLNRQIESNFTDIKKIIPSTFGSAECFNKLVVKINQRAGDTAAETSAEINTFLSESEKKVNAVLISIQNILLQKNNTGLNALEGFNQAQSEFVKLANTLGNDLKVLKEALSTRAQTDVATITADIQTCVTALEQDIKLVKQVYEVVTSLLAPFKQSATSAGSVAGEAFSFSLDKLPEFGRIDLKTTGRRENGSEIVVKLIARTGEDVNSNLPGEALDIRSVILQQIYAYSETNIGVILARPLGNEASVTLPSKVQFAPSGSLLLKFGSRKYMLWNNISPGIGVNVSTPDFNIDGAPDVSYGGVVTLFKNVISTGVSYNTKTSSSFWFVGLSLPFATLGLPIGGNVETQKMK